jgi:hypothetical protein
MGITINDVAACAQRAVCSGFCWVKLLLNALLVHLPLESPKKETANQLDTALSVYKCEKTGRSSIAHSVSLRDLRMGGYCR